MKKSIVEIYAMAVCFICAAISAISITIGIHNVVQIADPEFTMSAYEYSMHRDNESFLELKLMDIPKEYNNPYRDMSQQELTAARERSLRAALERERRNGQQSLLRCLIVVAVLSLMFWLHWILAKRTRRNAAATA